MQAPPEHLTQVPTITTDAITPTPNTYRATHTAYIARVDNRMWVVQVETLEDRQAASDLTEQLDALGYPTLIVDSPNDAHHHVRIGPYSARTQAESIRKDLLQSSAHIDQAVVIQHTDGPLTH